MRGLRPHQGSAHPVEDPTPLGSGRKESLPPPQATEPALRGGQHAHLVPPLLLLSAPLKLGSQGPSQGCAALLQLLPQLLQLHPLPAGQQESGTEGHCERVG